MTQIGTGESTRSTFSGAVAKAVRTAPIQCSARSTPSKWTVYWAADQVPSAATKVTSAVTRRGWSRSSLLERRAEERPAIPRIGIAINPRPIAVTAAISPW